MLLIVDSTFRLQRPRAPHTIRSDPHFSSCSKCFTELFWFCMPWLNGGYSLFTVCIQSICNTKILIRYSQTIQICQGDYQVISYFLKFILKLLFLYFFIIFSSFYNSQHSTEILKFSIIVIFWKHQYKFEKNIH